MGPVAESERPRKMRPRWGSRRVRLALAGLAATGLLGIAAFAGWPFGSAPSPGDLLRLAAVLAGLAATAVVLVRRPVVVLGSSSMTVASARPLQEDFEGSGGERAQAAAAVLRGAPDGGPSDLEPRSRTILRSAVLRYRADAATIDVAVEGRRPVRIDASLLHDADREAVVEWLDAAVVRRRAV
jgi:hypothetical protein